MTEPGQPDPRAAERKAEQKAAKKTAKAQAKKAKKAQKAAQSQQAGGESDSGTTPAERSAAAAERQVKLQRMRVLIALLTFAVAAASFLITYWTWNGRNAPVEEEPVPKAPAEKTAEPAEK